MSTSMAAARPTRRALVHGVAWSVPVVAMAATAPAFAASGEAKAAALADTAVKWNSGNGPGARYHVSWDILLTNGTKIIDTTTIKFTYIPTSGGSRGFEAFTVYGFNPTDTSWGQSAISSPVTGQYVITATNGNNHTAFTSYSVHVDFYGTANNSAGSVEALVTYTYTDGTTSTATIPKVTWRPGSQHPAGT